MKEIKANFPILVTTFIINLFVLFNYINNEKTLHGIGYFLFFYVSIFTIHFFTNRFKPQNEIEVKNPIKEFKTILLFTCLGIGFVALNYFVKSINPNLGFLIKMPIILGLLFFTCPLGILIYLIRNKYKMMQIGLVVQPLINLLLGFIICGITGFFAYFFNREGILFQQAYKEFGGILGILLQGVIGAALFEEFMRFAIQSRFEKIYTLNGFHILFAAIIWAIMHFPVTYFKSNEVISTLLYCIQIIPIGCVWGYLTHRTKSILPAVIVHGLNMWGIQNS